MFGLVRIMSELRVSGELKMASMNLSAYDISAFMHDSNEIPIADGISLLSGMQVEILVCSVYALPVHDRHLEFY